MSTGETGHDVDSFKFARNLVLFSCPWLSKAIDCITSNLVHFGKSRALTIRVIFIRYFLREPFERGYGVQLGFLNETYRVSITCPCFR